MVCYSHWNANLSENIYRLNLFRSCYIKRTFFKNIRKPNFKRKITENWYSLY